MPDYIRMQQRSTGHDFRPLRCKAGAYSLGAAISCSAHSRIGGQLPNAVSQLAAHPLQCAGICFVAGVGRIHLDCLEPKLPA